LSIIIVSNLNHVSNISIRSFTMDTPIFVDLQGFIVNEHFIVKESAVLKDGCELSHHIFEPPMSWDLLTRKEKLHATWVIANHHNLHWNDGYIKYNRAKDTIRKAVLRGLDPDTMTVIYVKGGEKKEWLQEILGHGVEEYTIRIETMDTDFDDIARLEDLSAIQTFHCADHTQHCAMKNVIKLCNWWKERREALMTN